jgi:hypothetical protein
MIHRRSTGVESRHSNDNLVARAGERGCADADVCPPAAACTAMDFRSKIEEVMNGLRLEFDMMVERPGRG